MKNMPSKTYVILSWNTEDILNNIPDSHFLNINNILFCVPWKNVWNGM